MTPLEAIIRRRIEREGPVTVAEYMSLCLGHPDHGYYMTCDPLGRGGDFITAPEISQMFGELIAAWCISCWQAMGSPVHFALVEFGPGRGTLMADLLRATAQISPDFARSAATHLIETSPALRDRQAKRLSAYVPVWHEDIATLPKGPIIAVMNEFFDALPVRQFVGVEERRVELVEDRLAFISATPSTIRETCPAAIAIIGELTARITMHSGAALVIDYGYEGPATGDTLQAVRDHAYADPLKLPGEADLTAHVDFTALAHAARRAGAHVAGPVSQGSFLQRLGIEGRAARLNQLEEMMRLTSPDAMGELFRVMAVTSGFLPEGFGSLINPLP